MEQRLYYVKGGLRQVGIPASSNLGVLPHIPDTRFQVQDIQGMARLMIDRRSISYASY